MDGNLWERVYQLVMSADHTQKGQPIYSDRVIVLVALRAIKDDQSINWACQAENWQGLSVPESLPSQPTMSRRLRSPGVQALMKAVESCLQRPLEPTEVIAVDARPLTISRYSKDPDAEYGYALCGIGLGYKFHAIWAHGPVPLAWQVHTLRANEATVATEQLVPSLPETKSRPYLLGDAGYDVNKLYAASATRGYRLVARPQRPGRGLGHRRHHPDRISGLKLLRSRWGHRLMIRRNAIERSFGNWSVRPEGLSELPKHVRRLHRVQLFVQGKIILNGIRILMNRNQFPLAAT